MSKLLLSTALALAFAFAGAAQQNPIAWSVKQAPTKPLKAGEAFSVRIAVEIPQGWHVYSITQPEGGPIATRISLPEGQPFQLAGPIEGPTPKVARDESFGMDVETYDPPEAVFTLPLKAGAAAGKTKLLINAYFQACDDKMCLPPKTARLETEIDLR